MNIYTTFRSDKRKNPKIVSAHYLSYDEILSLRVGEHIYATDLDGKIVQVKVTSIHTWKRKPDVRIGWKYGLYEYGTEIITPDVQQYFFVSEPSLAPLSLSLLPPTPALAKILRP